MSSVVLEQSHRCEEPCEKHGVGPAYKDVVNIGRCDLDKATYLDGPYPGQALLSPIRACSVLDLSHNIRDK